MTETEALCMARQAVQEAILKHGRNRRRLIEALESAGQRDPQLMEAFAIAGYLTVQSKAAEKH